MDDLDIVSSLHRPAYLPEHCQPVPQIQTALVAVFVERQPDNKLHYEVRQTVLGRSAAKEVCDVRVIECCGYLALASKAFEDEIGIHSALNKFDRDGLIELSVDSRRPVDNAHPSAADLFLKAIHTDAAPDHRIGRDVLKLVH